jgi:hypothetical protein
MHVAGIDKCAGPNGMLWLEDTEHILRFQAATRAAITDEGARDASLAFQASAGH